MDNIKKRDIEKKLIQYGIKNYYINDDLTVDVDGDLNTSTLAQCLIDVKFGTINGDFDCSRLGLKSLINCPIVVKGDYKISHNRLVRLEGIAEYIGGDLWIQNNYLNELNFYNSNIIGEIYCWGNKDIEDIIQIYSYGEKKGDEKIGSLKSYYTLIRREEKINQIINE